MERVIARPGQRALGPRDPASAPFHQRAIPRSDISFPFLVPPPQYQARALEGGRRPQQPRRASSPHRPIHRDSPHLASIHPAPIAASRRHARESSRGRSRTLATCVLPPRSATPSLQVCNFFRALSFSSARSNPPKSEQIFPMIFEL